MLSEYKISGNKIEIKTAYSEDIVKVCHRWAGKYDKSAGAWIVPAARLTDVQHMLGVNLADQVEVEVGTADWVGYAQIQVGWYVLAGRRSRDYQANVYADLVAGEIPASGGSVKNPAVGASNGARFRLWVPRDFAVARGLQIVTDDQAVDVAALKTERGTLAKRLAEIDAILAGSSI